MEVLDEEGNKENGSGMIKVEREGERRRGKSRKSQRRKDRKKQRRRKKKEGDGMKRRD